MKIKKYSSHALWGALLAAAVLFAAPDGRADLRPLTDGDMAKIRGAGGFSIGLDDIRIYVHSDRLGYTDTDTGNSLVLEDLTVTDGRLGPALFAAGNLDADGDGLCHPLTLDVGAIDDPASPVYGKALVVLEALDFLQEVDIHAETLRFCGQELGMLDIGVIRRPSFYWMLGAHDAGIDFEYAQRLSIDTLSLTYNDSGESFGLSGIQFGAEDPGAPEDPATWQMSGLFKIGAMADGNPATFDVGADQDGVLAVALNLPMAGSLRVAHLQWAGADFGPLAIDGIQVHRLAVRFVP